MSVLALLATLVYTVPHAQAAQVTSRSVTIGSSLPGATTTHRFAFNLASAGTLGSVEFEYCTNNPFVDTACDAPVGFSAAGAVLQAQAGETGFTIGSASTANKIVLTRIPVANAAIPVAYTFGNIVNQSGNNAPSYVRISTYATDDATGPFTDDGAVAYTTTSAITVRGYVPPYLTFCVGVTVATNCSATFGNKLNFGELVTFSPRAVSSQFAVATNDPTGYTTFVSGPTMTSGNNIIPGLGAPSGSQPGTSQFGMNLRANSNPAVGSEPTGPGTGIISANFNNPNQFYFNNQALVQSPIPSDFNAFTVSYLVNVSRDQQPGVYVTTMTYIASAAF